MKVNKRFAASVVMLVLLTHVSAPVSAQPQGNPLKYGADKLAFTASDGSPLTVRLDGDGHIVYAEGQYRGLKRTLTLPRWPKNDTMTFSETGKPPLTISRTIDDPTFTILGESGDRQLIVSFRARGIDQYIKMTYTITRRSGGVTTVAPVGEIRKAEQVPLVTQSAFADFFGDYTPVVDFFGPCLSSCDQISLITHSPIPIRYRPTLR